MAVPAWALLLLVAIPLVQVPLVFYLGRRFELDGDAPLPTPTRALWTDGASVRAERVAAYQPGDCRRCGTANDPAYTFCGECLARL